jgi:hypothetical protein
MYGKKIRLVTTQRTYLSISGFEAWTGSPQGETETTSVAFGNKENGFCVTSKNRDQNSGVKKLNNLDINTAAREAECLRLCAAVDGVTGCEGIWS